MPRGLGFSIVLINTLEKRISEERAPRFLDTFIPDQASNFPDFKMSEKKDQLEDAKVQTIEDGEVTFTGSNGAFDEKQTKKLVRKLDRHILPVLVILYLLSFLDRTNIGNARLANLERDLDMSGLDYNVWYPRRSGFPCY